MTARPVAAKLLTRDEARRITAHIGQAAGAVEGKASAVKRNVECRSLSVRKRRLPDVHAATLLVARDFLQ
jgi:hypothetical protein